MNALDHVISVGFVSLLFTFSEPRNFTTVSLHTAFAHQLKAQVIAFVIFLTSY